MCFVKHHLQHKIINVLTDSVKNGDVIDQYYIVIVIFDDSRLFQLLIILGQTGIFMHIDIYS